MTSYVQNFSLDTVDDSSKVCDISNLENIEQSMQQDVGLLNLPCPMCCGETFTDSEALKHHLLNMTDNLYCPNCSSRIYSIAALIQHLDSCGKKALEQDELLQNDNQEENSNEVERHTDEKKETDLLMDENDVTMNESFLATVSEEGIMMVGEGRTIQVDENGDIQVVEKFNSSNQEIMQFENCDQDANQEKENHIFSMPSLDSDSFICNQQNKTLLDMPDSNDVLENETETLISISQVDSLQFDASSMLKVKKEYQTVHEDEESDIEYNCSTCGMSFNSVMEHIKEYHDGQEVVLEMAEQQLNELKSAESISQTTMLETLPSETVSENLTLTTSNPMKQRQSMNTLRTEECVDNDGKLYTRKVVQIERFWDRTPVTLSSTKAPMIEKFFSNVEGVKVRDKSVTVAPTKMYRCNQCLEQFAKLCDFRVHSCLQGNNRCQQCDLKFATTKALQLHMRVHDNGEFGNQKIFLCTVCGTEFSTHKSLRLHSRMHAPVRARHVDAPEGTEEETFVCDECGTTLSESYRTAHMALHAGETITCTVCNRKFDSEDSLLMHAAVHTELNGFNTLNEQMLMPPTTQDIQDPSLMTTSASSSLMVSTSTANLESVEGHSQKPYQCQHCGRRFTRPHEKVKHERIHTGEKPHSCEVCGKKFRVSYCLTLHMRTHTGVRPYECQHCGKRFKASSVYNHHLLTHGDERAYTCPYCPKTFKTRVQLAGHKNSHTKPFRCTECSRPFASLYAARAHIQTHKKDNNLKFSCSICGASYGRAFALKDHLKQHEKDLSAPTEALRDGEIPDDISSFILAENDDIDEEDLIVPSSNHCDPIQTELNDMKCDILQ